MLLEKIRKKCEFLLPLYVIRHLSDISVRENINHHLWLLIRNCKKYCKIQPTTQCQIRVFRTAIPIKWFSSEMSDESLKSCPKREFSPYFAFTLSQFIYRSQFLPIQCQCWGYWAANFLRMVKCPKCRMKFCSYSRGMKLAPILNLPMQCQFRYSYRVVECPKRKMKFWSPLEKEK